MIREEEPPRPSTRLSASKDSLPSISAQRQTEPAKLTRLVRGELDWIVMKALEKDRNRRYETANGFALDVQRYLADEPVQACPPSAGYRLAEVRAAEQGAAGGRRSGRVLPGGAGGRGRLGGEGPGGSAAGSGPAGSGAAGGPGGGRRPRPGRGAGLLPGGSAAGGVGGGGPGPGAAGPRRGERGTGRARERVRADVDMAARLEGIRLERAAVKDGNFDYAGADSRLSGRLPGLRPGRDGAGRRRGGGADSGVGDRGPVAGRAGRLAGGARAASPTRACWPCCGGRTPTRGAAGSGTRSSAATGRP